MRSRNANRWDTVTLPSHKGALCQRQEHVPKAGGGGEKERGIFPLSLAGFGGFPPRKFYDSEHLYMRFYYISSAYFV